MKHTILTVFLTLGVVGGLAYGCTHHRHEHFRHKSHMRDEIADICVDATLRTLKANGQDPKGTQLKSP
jgi:hypothetical protein